MILLDNACAGANNKIRGFVKVNTITDSRSAMRYGRIRNGTIWRLPAYLRGAMHLSHEGIENVPGKELARLLGANPWQIRKDFSRFGDFGGLSECV